MERCRKPGGMAVGTPGLKVTKVRVSHASKGRSSRRRSWSERGLGMEKPSRAGRSPLGLATAFALGQGTGF